MMSAIKAFTLAFMTVFAMSAMAASAAQAEQVGDFWAEAGTDEIDLAAEGHQRLVTAGPKTITCTVVDGHAAYEGEGPEQTATDVGYTNCHTTSLGLNFPTTVAQEAGCHYTFTAGTYTPGAGISHGSVHICGSTISVFNAGGHTTKRCEIHVPAQTINGVTFINGTGPSGKMAVTVEANGVNVANTTITDFNTLGCNTHETVTSVYTGSIWAEGINWLEGANGLDTATDTTVTGT